MRISGDLLRCFINREETVCQARDFFSHDKFFQPFFRNAGLAIKRSRDRAADRRGGVGVVCKLAAFK
jgi:hypothetical protein